MRVCMLCKYQKSNLKRGNFQYNKWRERKDIHLTTEKNVLKVSKTRSLQSISSIITQHLHRAIVSNILTLLEKCGLAVSASSAKILTMSLKMSWNERIGVNFLYRHTGSEIRHMLVTHTNIHRVSKEDIKAINIYLVTLRYLSSKGGSGAMTRNISLIQMATRSLTSLQLQTLKAVQFLTKHLQLAAKNKYQTNKANDKNILLAENLQQ